MPFCLVLYDLSLLTVIRRAFLNVITNFFLQGIQLENNAACERDHEVTSLYAP
jgi:hypothetical protein